MGAAHYAALAALLLASSAAALRVTPLPVGLRASSVLARCPTIVACDASVAEAAPEAATSEAVAAEEVDPDVPVPGSFLKWYRSEKAREAYEEENPTDVVAAAMARLDGPLKTAAVLA